MLRLTALASFAAGAAGHAMMTFPKPRNGLDGSIEPFKSWAWYPDQPVSECNASDPKASVNCRYYGFNNGVGSCPHAAKNGRPGALNGSNGQACYW